MSTPTCFRVPAFNINNPKFCKRHSPSLVQPETVSPLCLCSWKEKFIDLPILQYNLICHLFNLSYLLITEQGVMGYIQSCLVNLLLCTCLPDMIPKEMSTCAVYDMSCSMMPSQYQPSIPINLTMHTLTYF